MPTTGIAECDDYVKAAWTLGACEKVPLDVRNSIKENLVSIGAMWQSLTGDALTRARQSCKAGSDAMRQASIAAGC